MPELPEVEFCFQRLSAWLNGRRIVSASADDGPPLREVSADVFVESVRGQDVLRMRRHGKQIFVDLSGGLTLWLHLGMTGKWVQVTEQEARRWARVVLVLDEGPRLEFVDPRRFGRIKLCPTVDAEQELVLSGLGPDALSLCEDPMGFEQRFTGSRRAIKVALLDQARLAGVGNIYAAEALFDARIDPVTPAADLTSSDYQRLAVALERAMRVSIERELGGEIKYLHEGKAKNPFLVYGREGEACHRCEGRIERFEQSARSTFFCRTCQRPGA